MDSAQIQTSDFLPVPQQRATPSLPVAPWSTESGLVANVVEAGSLRVALHVERVTKRFVFFRLTACGSPRRLRCTVATVDPSHPEQAIVLMQSVLAASDVLDAGFIVRSHLAHRVTAELSGSDVALIVRAPEVFEAGPLRRSLDALGGSAPWSLGLAAGLGIATCSALVGFGTFAAFDRASAGRIPAAAASSEASRNAAPLAALPAAPQPHAAAAPLTSRAQAEPLAAAMAPPAQRGTLIAAASLEKPIVPAGQPIIVNYRVADPTGDVRLIDDRGTVRATALLTSGGSSILLAPQVNVEEDFRVAIDVEAGTRREESELPVRVEAARAEAGRLELASASEPGQMAPPTIAEERSAVRSGRPFVLSQRSVVSGKSLWLTVVRHVSDMRATMLDQDGNEVTSVNIDRKANRVELKTPPGLFPELYTVDVSYIDAAGQEHAVTPITILEPPITGR
jgi:hypothetical protein